jgi:hypothetical protein
VRRPSLWFVVPAHGREELAAICFRQLRRTCDLLIADGVDATAVVIADDGNLKTARKLGFGTVRRDNKYVSRKFNDCIQAALDRDWNPHPADFVVPFGSDDWVDHRLFLDLPRSDTVIGFQRMSFVREDGREITTRHLKYRGGSGIRIYPRKLLVPFGYRPAEEDRERGCDTSILSNVEREHSGNYRIEHRHLHDRQIVDWKTRDVQLNSYASLRRHPGDEPADPFTELAGVYPDVALAEMRAHYHPIFSGDVRVTEEKVFA